MKLTKNSRSMAVVACGLLSLALYAKPRAPQTNAAILHALNRLTWGPAPGDFERVKQLGLNKWIDLQLHPERIAENPELESRLTPLDTLHMTAAELIQHYPPQQAVRAMANGREALPRDPQARAIAEREIEKFRERQENKEGADQKNDLKQASFDMLAGSDEDRPRLADVLTTDQLRQFRAAPPDQRVEIFESLPADVQQRAIDAMPRPMATDLATRAPLTLQRRIEIANTPEQIAVTDLQQAKLLRAIYTNRQLEDVLTDFWFNHFNIFLDKGADRFLTTEYENTAIRPHVLGKFYDLLQATAESPAMLFYLDNWQSVDPNAQVRLAREREQRREDTQEMRRLRAMGRMGPLNPYPYPRPVYMPPPPPPRGVKGNGARKPARGLNENYGRELMELHTLGVDGGYTQKDVTEVARCFTGWTIRYLNEKPQFYFDERMHDPGEKIVLGKKVKAGGMNDGLTVLHMLAQSPATAHHISFELAQRFVADTPPEPLVDAMARTFLSSDGDLRKVMQTMIDSREFWDEQYYRGKVKSPLEMVVSAARALQADVVNPMRLTQIVAQMGEPLYRQQPPTGYPNTGDSWVSSTGLLARLNYALALTSNRLPGVHVDLSKFAPGEADAPTVSNSLFSALLANNVSPQTQSTIEKALANSSPATQAGAQGNPVPLTPAQTEMVAGLILGSPEFQRR